ncbi:hypothetical protein BASA83_005293 [Batrachochytrium salamandrivorans]|nr:hypothetical protein BASA83_005293 [Batrachochytrium salamandrivorans]
MCISIIRCRPQIFPRDRKGFAVLQTVARQHTLSQHSMSNQNALVQSYVARFDNHIKRESGQAISDALSIESEHVASIASALDLLHHGQRLTGGVSRLSFLGEIWFFCTLTLFVLWPTMILSLPLRLRINSHCVSIKCLCSKQDGVYLFYTPSSRSSISKYSRRCFSAGFRSKDWPFGRGCPHKNRAFSACVTDRVVSYRFSRKWGTYYVLNSTNLCSTILRSLQSADLPEIFQISYFSSSDTKYFTGVIAFYNEKFDAASSDLMFALDRSLGKTVQDKRNKQLILDYLVPAQLIRASVRSGNVQQFDVALIRHQSELIRRGTWLTVRACEITSATDAVS